jgi:hypothetical protein
MIEIRVDFSWGLKLYVYFRWKVIGGGKIIRNPGLVFPNGLPIEISEKEK